MMVGTYANTLACVAGKLNGVKRYRCNDTIKSGVATGADIAAELRGDPKQ
jgi:hypothetical protein